MRNVSIVLMIALAGCGSSSSSGGSSSSNDGGGSVTSSGLCTSTTQASQGVAQCTQTFQGNVIGCYAYTGSGYTTDKATAECTDDGDALITSGCPTDGRTDGHCVERCGADGEEVLYEYTAGYTSVKAQAQCSQAGGSWLTN